jgi:ATP-dependent Clp protease ATP-binding subunit ClpA
MSRMTLAEDARAALVSAADAEAHRRGRRRIGTEDLLLGLLAEPGGPVSVALGVDLDRAREASARLDARALEAFGVRAEIPPSPPARLARGRRSFTGAARSAIERSVRLARRDRSNRVTAAHLTAGVLSAHEPDDALALLGELGVDMTHALAAAMEMVDAQHGSP